MDPLEIGDNAGHPAELTGLSDADLKAEVQRLTSREREISFQRRFLHGQIEMARSELMRRLARAGGADLDPADLAELNRILSGGPEEAA